VVFPVAAHFLIVGICLALALVAFLIADVPVSRSGVDKFAVRHRFALTEANAAQVLAYLRITRRWRTAGLVFVSSLSIGIGLLHQRLTISLAAILAGLFGAILLAEIRMAGLTTARPAASLIRRRLPDYLHPSGRRTFFGALAVAVPLSLLVLMVSGADLANWWFAIFAPATVGLISVWSMRRTVRRTQQAAEPERLAADNAIRRQSVQTLAACASALIAYAILSQLGMLLTEMNLEIATALLIPVGLIGVPWLARTIATRPAPTT
jgi:hypothetical protein